MTWVGSVKRRSSKWLPLFKISLESEMHSRVGILVILQLAPSGQCIVRWAKPPIIIPILALWWRDGFDVSQDVALRHVNSFGLSANQLEPRACARCSGGFGNIVDP